MRFAIFRDRNFLIGCFFMVVMGLMLFSSMALSTPFMQNVLGYPIHDRRLGARLARHRHAGRRCSMIGRLLRIFEARYLILIGLTLTACTLYQMTGFTAEHVEHADRDRRGSCRASAWASCSFRSAPSRSSPCRRISHRRHRDLTLVRNVASSVGISVVIANLTSKTSEMHASSPSTSRRSTTRCRCPT